MEIKQVLKWGIQLIEKTFPKTNQGPDEKFTPLNASSVPSSITSSSLVSLHQAPKPVFSTNHEPSLAELFNFPNENTKPKEKPTLSLLLKKKTNPVPQKTTTITTITQQPQKIKSLEKSNAPAPLQKTFQPASTATNHIETPNILKKELDMQEIEKRCIAMNKENPGSGDRWAIQIMNDEKRLKVIQAVQAFSQMSIEERIALGQDGMYLSGDAFDNGMIQGAEMVSDLGNIPCSGWNQEIQNAVSQPLYDPSLVLKEELQSCVIPSTTLEMGDARIGQTCQISWDELQCGDQIVEFPCHHIFKYEMIQQRTCPVCQTSL